MFVGHYAAAFALKKVEPKASLGMLFIAVQLVDIIFFPLTIIGIERFNLIENYTQSTHFELIYMPFTHSLLAAFLWAVLIYYLYKITSSKVNKVAIVMGLAVLSHWFLDLVVHTPDLPLWSDNSTKFGFGLWNNAIATMLLESLILISAFLLFLSTQIKNNTTIKTKGSVFIGFLILLNAVNIFGPLTSDNKIFFALLSFFLYFFIAFFAFRLDRE